MLPNLTPGFPSEAAAAVEGNGEGVGVSAGLMGAQPLLQHSERWWSL